MKATGIVRRVDDLGRVVIPKEIRNTLGIHENDMMEIFTEDNGAIVFKKYQPEKSSLDTTALKNFLDDEGQNLSLSDQMRLIDVIRDINTIKENYNKEQ